MLRHLGPPLFLSLGFAFLYVSPGFGLPCPGRALVALALIGLSILGALACMAMGVRSRHARKQAAVWFLTAVALLLPALVVLLVELALVRA